MYLPTHYINRYNNERQETNSELQTPECIWTKGIWMYLLSFSVDFFVLYRNGLIIATLIEASNVPSQFNDVNY